MPQLVLEFGQWWNGLSRERRVAIGVCALVFAALSIVLTIVGRPRMVPLFATPLHSEQLAEVDERLADWNVAFTPGADNVRVDDRRRNELLLRLSLAGVPHPHVPASSELLATAGALTPQSVLDAQARAGLAGDLALGLRGIDGIADARVIIAPEQPALFADEHAHDATASVRLALRPGARPTAAQIAGVRAFVAAGVPGLAPERVTVVDDAGVALGERAPQSDASEIERTLQSALDTAFGPGVTIVRVREQPDQHRRETHSFERAPARGVAVSSDRSEETYAADRKRYAKSHFMEERGELVREERSESAPGELTRISVAVLVDAARSADLGAIRAFALTSAGVDPGRGDTIAVEAVPFARVAAPRMALAAVAAGAAAPYLPSAAAVIAVAFVLFRAGPPIGRKLYEALHGLLAMHTRRKVAGFAPNQVRGVLEGEPPHTAAAIISALPAATAAAVLDLYPPDERAAIVRRLTQERSPLIPGFEAIIGRA